MKIYYKSWFAMLAFGSGCGTEEKLECGITDIKCQSELPIPPKEEEYKICKNTDNAGNPVDNCAYELSENGECYEGDVQVKSSKRASEYECVMDL